ncbi:MAG TPA: DUF3419 family protein [Polyangiaceae bacterium]|jgi:S-adenosylmethionine-diacylglycerol 3-amino-3-carboxypropyl transferase
MSSSLHKLLAEGVIRYSQVWEDHALVEGALDVGPGDDVLSIASAGCNVLALLLRQPRSIVALDLNPAQTSLVELKLRGIEALERDELGRLIGVFPGDDRLALYERVRGGLSPAAQQFWDAREPLIAEGIHGSGRLEQFFRGFYEGLLPAVHAAETTARLLAMNDPAEQTRFFETTYGTEAMHRAFTGYFTRERLASEGRDPRQMRYVAAMDVAEFFWGRFRWVTTSLPARDNFYLHSFLTGRYPAVEEALPPYLQREPYARLKALVPHVRIELADVESALRGSPAGTFSKANLSDLFEYLSDEATDALFEALGEQLRPGGRVCFWNLLVPREPPAALRPRLRPRTASARALYERDRSWFYRSFHVEEVASE